MAMEETANRKARQLKVKALSQPSALQIAL
jgi:hypothetical protein